MKENGKTKSWNDLKDEFKLEERVYFKRIQLINAILSNSKINPKHSNTYLQNLILLDHHLVKSILYLILKSFSRQILEKVLLKNSSRNNKSKLQKYFHKSIDSKK